MFRFAKTLTHEPANYNQRGTHFDMGMAFALGKKIVIVENEELTEGKSFQRMLLEWQQSA